MDMRTMGRSGLVVSAVGLGCNQFGQGWARTGGNLDRQQSAAIVHRALDVGITHFDTADNYCLGSSEEYLGSALAGHRDEVVVATKFSNAMGDGPYRRGASRRNIVQSCEASLRRLNTDYIDLYYLHRPDAATPIAETLQALDDLVHHGKVRYIACSNLAGWQIADAHHTARTIGTQHFVAAQDHWNLVVRDVEAEVVPACAHFGMGVVPYFPLAAGLLTGKYRAGTPFPEGARLTRMADVANVPWFTDMLTPERLAMAERLALWVEDRGRTMVELAVSWLACQPTVASVIVGASRPDQVTTNAAAAEWRLSADELAAVDAMVGR